MLDPSIDMERHVLEVGVWEGDSVLVFRSVIKPGHTCVDIGANAGFNTIAMADLAGAQGRLVAFEPNPSIYRRLLRNIELNPAIAAVTKCEGLAVSNFCGALFFQPVNDGSNGYVRMDGAGNGAVPCRAITIDSYFGDIRIDFIKIDVEGHELEVLEGAEEVLRRDLPALFYESLVEHFAVEKLRRIEDLLVGLGYDLFRLTKDLKLVPTRYPYYHSNTLAIHRSKLNGYDLPVVW
jgi:FkbM family methyltransferase